MEFARVKDFEDTITNSLSERKNIYRADGRFVVLKMMIFRHGDRGACEESMSSGICHRERLGAQSK